METGGIQGGGMSSVTLFNSLLNLTGKGLSFPDALYSVREARECGDWGGCCSLAHSFSVPSINPSFFVCAMGFLVESLEEGVRCLKIAAVYRTPRVISAHNRISCGDFVIRMARNKFSSILSINEKFAYHPTAFPLSLSRVGIEGKEGPDRLAFSLFFSHFPP